MDQTAGRSDQCMMSSQDDEMSSPVGPERSFPRKLPKPEKAAPRWRKAVANARAVGICPRGLAFAEEESWVTEHTFRRSRRIVTSLKNQFWGFCGIHRMS